VASVPPDNRAAGFVHRCRILLSAWLAGIHGAISAAIGGSIGIIAGLAFAALAARSRSGSAGEALYIRFEAEASRCPHGCPPVDRSGDVQRRRRNRADGTFIATVLIFTMAILVLEK